MSPRYEHDPTKFAAALTVFPKGEYEFVIGAPKSFERQARAGHQSIGIRFPLKCVTPGPFENKKTIYSIYLHSDGGAQMAKRFQMAAAGLTVNEANEQEYDAKAAGKDWSFDPSTGEVGEAWKEYEGIHVVCDVDVSINKDQNDKEIQQQDWGTWSPID